MGDDLKVIAQMCMAMVTQTKVLVEQIEQNQAQQIENRGPKAKDLFNIKKPAPVCSANNDTEFFQFLINFEKATRGLPPIDAFTVLEAACVGNKRCDKGIAAANDPLVEPKNRKSTAIDHLKTAFTLTKDKEEDLLLKHLRSVCFKTTGDLHGDCASFSQEWRDAFDLATKHAGLVGFDLADCMKENRFAREEKKRILDDANLPPAVSDKIKTLCLTKKDAEINLGFIWDSVEKIGAEFHDKHGKESALEKDSMGMAHYADGDIGDWGFPTDNACYYGAEQLQEPVSEGNATENAEDDGNDNQHQDSALYTKGWNGKGPYNAKGSTGKGYYYPGFNNSKGDNFYNAYKGGQKGKKGYSPFSYQQNRFNSFGQQQQHQQPSSSSNSNNGSFTSGDMQKLLDTMAQVSANLQGLTEEVRKQRADS